MLNHRKQGENGIRRPTSEQLILLRLVGPSESGDLIFEGLGLLAAEGIQNPSDFIANILRRDRLDDIARRMKTVAPE